MASTNIRSISVGGILIQSGNGTPNHLSLKGSLYTDLNTALEYINKDGLSIWATNIDSTNISGFTSGITTFDVFVTGGTYSAGTAIFTNNSGNTFNVTGFSTGNSSTDTYTTGFTYSDNNNLIIKQNQGQPDLSVLINTMTGLTINGALTASTIVKSGGTSSQFLKADGSIDSTAYLPLSATSGTDVFTSGSTGLYSIRANNPSGTDASGNYSYASGFNSKASGATSFVHGSGSTAIADGSIVLGRNLIGLSADTTYVDSLNVRTTVSSDTVNYIAVIDSDGTIKARNADTFPHVNPIYTEEFLWTGGSQNFTLVNTVVVVHIVSVQGQGALSESQYNVIGNSVTITDPLDVNDYIVITYASITPTDYGHIFDAYSVFHGSIIGGGVLSSTAGQINWTKRFISISQAKGIQIPSGYFDILQPPDGTIVHGVGSLPDRTFTLGTFLVDDWDILWYELPLGSGSTTNNNNFYRSNFVSSINFSIPAHWVMIAQRNADENSIYWGDGSITTEGSSFTQGPTGPWIQLPSTGRDSFVQANISYRYELYGNVVRLRGVVWPTNATAGGLGSAGIIGTITDSIYRPVIPGHFSNSQPHAAFVCGTSKLDLIVGTSIVTVDCLTGQVKYGQQSTDSHFEISIDISWSR